MWKKIGIESFHKTFIHSSVTSVGETSSKLSLVELHLSFHQAIEPNDFAINQFHVFRDLPQQLFNQSTTTFAPICLTSGTHQN